jgi:hypothetical protein
VAPHARPPGLLKVDASIRNAWTGREVRDDPRRAMSAEVRTEFVAGRARSVPAGLLEVAQCHRTSLLVTGGWQGWKCAARPAMLN